jgi:hypothetical protein
MAEVHCRRDVPRSRERERDIAGERERERDDRWWMVTTLERRSGGCGTGCHRLYCDGERERERESENGGSIYI